MLTTSRCFHTFVLQVGMAGLDETRYTRDRDDCTIWPILAGRKDLVHKNSTPPQNFETWKQEFARTTEKYCQKCLKIRETKFEVSFQVEISRLRQDGHFYWFLRLKRLRLRLFETKLLAPLLGCFETDIRVSSSPGIW